MVIVSISVTGSAHTPNSSEKPYTSSWRSRLLPCFLSGSKPQTRCDPGVKVTTKPPNLLKTTTIIELGSKAYVVRGQISHRIRLTDSPFLDALACFDVRKSVDLVNAVQSAYESFLEEDDVFCDSFLRYVLLLSDETSVDGALVDLLASWGCDEAFLVPTSEPIPPGPYFFSSRGLYQPWRLYPDYVDAFVLSTVPSQDDPHRYEDLHAAACGASSLSVAVPSRLRYTRSAKSPLAGMRIGVKDLFHLKGVHTGCGNRAYRRLHGPSDTTSAKLRSVLDGGGIVVGKTKTVEFGGSQEVIGDWCDYFYSFNIRGDGYLASTGSSTGSASSLAAYPWLDITLGTDAGGSIRDPAVAHGIYGFRPSHDGKDTPDVVIPCGIFHTVGFLGRSSKTMLDFGRHWLGSSEDIKSLMPRRILFPRDFHSDHAGVQTIAEGWVAELAKWLGAKRFDVSIEDTWSTTKPEASLPSFFETFRKTFIEMTYSDFWTYLAAFRKEYRETFDSEPYVCKVTQFLWNKGKLISETRKEELLREVKLHNDWFLHHLLDDEESIIVVPRYKLDYRDEYLPPPEYRDFEGFDSNLHASLSGVPNLIVPIGQCLFHSEITGREEFFPVSLSVIAPKGKDIGLLSLIHEYLTDRGLPTSVSTGPKAF